MAFLYRIFWGRGRRQYTGRMYRWKHVYAMRYYSNTGAIYIQARHPRVRGSCRSNGRVGNGIIVLGHPDVL